MRKRHFITSLISRPQVVLCLLAVVTMPCTIEVGHAEDYRAREVGRHIELMTPQGNRVLFGDFSFDTARDYKISIPIKELMAPKNEPPLPTADEEESAAPAEAKRSPQSLPQDPNDPAQAAPYNPKAEKTSDYDDTEKLIVEANHFYNKGKFYEASMYVEELIRKKPAYVRAWVMKGSLLYVQGHKDLAKKAWEQAKNLEPENREVKDLFERYKLP